MPIWWIWTFTFVCRFFKRLISTTPRNGWPIRFGIKSSQSDLPMEMYQMIRRARSLGIQRIIQVAKIFTVVTYRGFWITWIICKTLGFQVSIWIQSSKRHRITNMTRKIIWPWTHISGMPSCLSNWFKQRMNVVFASCWTPFLITLVTSRSSGRMY